MRPGTSVKPLALRRSSVKPSSRFDTHFKFFGIDPGGKTIRSIALELKERANEDFIRKCHFHSHYRFNDFRITKTYKMQRELKDHLLQLSSWLFRENVFPVSLKKELTRAVRYRNPYTSFDPIKTENTDLQSLNHVTLSMLHNNNLSRMLPDEDLQRRLLQEFENREIEISNINFFEKVEIIKRNKKFLLLNLSSDQRSSR